jgi:hypothetical protein
MDLMNLKPTSDTVEVILKHPNTLDPLLNDDGSEMTVTLHASHSKEYKKIVHEQQDRRIKMMQKKAKSQISAQDIERDATDLLAKVTAAWDITYGGEQPKLTVTKAKEVFTEVFWIREQIEEAFSDSMDFTTA